MTVPEYSPPAARDRERHTGPTPAGSHPRPHRQRRTRRASETRGGWENSRPHQPRVGGIDRTSRATASAFSQSMVRGGTIGGGLDGLAVYAGPAGFPMTVDAPPH